LQLRQETGARLVARVFAPELSSEVREKQNGLGNMGISMTTTTTQGKPSKWWTCWSRRKFLNVSLSR
jgi:hypothetical protein